MTLRRVILIMAAAVLFPAAAHSLDEVQSRLLGEYGLPLRWYNVEGAPSLVVGDDPVRDGDSPRHLLKLEPGRLATVLLPAWETLRLDAGSGTLADDDLEVSFSSGGGLFRHDSGVRSTDGRSLVFSPNFPSPLLARIARPARRQASIAVAAVISSREPLGEIAPHRRLVPLPLERVEIGRPGRPGEERFWSMPGGRAVSIPVTGPVRVALENHFIYPEQESRRSFAYRVAATVDGGAPLLLEFETGPDMEPTRYNGEDQRRVLGRRQTGYLNIPAGEHTLTMRGDVSLLIRMLVQERSDYLVPRLNAPTPSAAEVEEEAFPPVLAGSFVGLGDRETVEAAADRRSSPVLRERAALRTARDNGRRDGGVAGPALMRDAGLLRPDYPAVRERAEEIAGIHTFYRDLFPDRAAPSASPTFRWFLPALLPEPDLHPFGVAAGEQHTAEMVRMLAGGTFFNVPDGKGAAYLYRLPERFVPSLLRVAVPADALKAGAELAVQFDDAPPQRLLPVAPPALPDGTVPISPAEAGLLLLADSHHAPRPVTLGGAFAAESPPAPLVAAAVAELPLPPRVRTVRLWKNGDSGRAVPAAVQYRTSGPYRLAETEFLTAEHATAPNGGRFPEFAGLLAAEPRKAAPAPFAPLAEGSAVAAAELESERLPLVRLIRSLERSYTAAVAPPPKGPAAAPSDSAAVEFSARSARLAAKEGDWLTALESWSIPVRSGSAAMRREGLFGQIEALSGLNEDYLAEHRLRGLFLYGEDDETRSRAMSALEQRYALAADLDSLLALQSAALLRKPQLPLLRSLGVTLLEAGEPEQALQAFLILPPAERPRAAVLQASLRLGWWQSFENTLAESADAQERSLWHGLRAMTDGRYDEALEALRTGGAKGNAWARHLEEGVRIRTALTEPDRETRLRAVVDWERWQTAHPGPRAWEPETTALAAAAGAVTLTNTARDTWFPAFRAAAGQSAVLRFAGPTKVRIEARPVHPAGSRTPLDGWLQIRDGEHLYVQPITGNMPAQGLAVVGDDGHAAGLGVEREIDLGPGIHELQVSGGSLDLFVRAYVFRPVIPCAALPPVTPETLAAAAAGLYTPIRPADIDSIPLNERIIRVSRDGGAEPRILPFTRRDLLAGGTASASSPAEAQAGLAALRPARTAGRDEQAALLAGKGDVDSLFALAADNSDPDIVRRVVLLLWASEQKPERRLQALSAVRALSASRGGVSGLTSVVDRLSRHGSWVPVTAVASSAGLRYLDVTGWRPETPALRIRRALLPLAADNEQILADMGHMVFTMVNKSPTVVELTLVADELAYLAPQPLVVSYQVDREPPRRLTLGAGEPPRSVALTVPSGEHAVRVGIEERYADQFLRVGLRERPAHPWRGSSSFTPVVSRIERPYQVARKREPIRLNMEGPAVLRIDELRDGNVTVSYRMVDAGLQQLEIAPEAGREEGLYRVFTHAVVAEKPLMPVRPTEIRREPVPPPAVTVASSPQPGAVRLTDSFPLGRQEDGTWSATGALVRRKPVEEGAEEDRSPEHFLEGSATYRYFNGERTYYEAGALARFREHGGPTLGMHAAVRGLPQPVAPFSWSLAGNLYLQRPDGGSLTPLGGSTEWAALLQGSISQMRELTPKTWHRPAISLFGRPLMSLSNVDGDQRKDVDQDIFTSYKANHRYGANFSESLIHRPWLDTLWHGTLSLVTNELDDGLVPDNLSLSLGWKQLLGEFQLNALYRGYAYMDDRNRSGTLLRDNLSLELTYNHWLGNLDRLEISLLTAWHSDLYKFMEWKGINLRGRNFTGLLSLTWHFDNGRGFRDFYPGEIDFHDLRKRMTPTSRNNGLAYEPK